jgi:hypothetical protein
MATVPWIELLLFMAAVALLALYGLVVSGHFPAELRAREPKTGPGGLTIWATVAVASLAAIVALVVAWSVLPWYAITIGAGAMLLAAPPLLRPFPDSFVNGRSALVVFAVGAAAIAVILRACATQQNVIDSVN